MSLLKKLTDYANSPETKAKAQELAEKAKQFANDPKRKEEFENVKRKVSEKLGKDDGAPKTDETPAPAPVADAGTEMPDAAPGGTKPPAA
jgi:hypothetical protein